MNEYISREDVLSYIYATHSSGGFKREDDYLWLHDRVINAPAADVQPVNQWISVKDRLPESEKEVLVWYRYTWGDGSTSDGFGINRWDSNTKQWRDGCLLKGVEVLCWQPLPESPKDGDIE